jgi:hypothetical protein
MHLRVDHVVSRRSTLTGRAERQMPNRAPCVPCPTCAESATVIDWRPSVAWIAFEGCPCGGFFVSADLLTGRLTQVDAKERGILRARILGLRAIAHEAWLTTDDGQPEGRLVVRAERPDRPP